MLERVRLRQLNISLSQVAVQVVVIKPIRVAVVVVQVVIVQQQGSLLPHKPTV
jgi:hypothetical protein